VICYWLVKLRLKNWRCPGAAPALAPFEWWQQKDDLISKALLEPLRRQGGIARRVLDIAMPEVRLDRAGIVAVVGELVAAGVAEHVGVRLDA
jgi:hypothetical protein